MTSKKETTKKKKRKDFEKVDLLRCIFRNIRIKNYKLFKEVATDFEPLTVILGANGCGKSSLLRALITLPWAVNSSLAIAVQDIGGGSGIFRDNQIRLEIDVQYGLLSENSAEIATVNHYAKLCKTTMNPEGFRVEKEILVSTDTKGKKVAYGESIRSSYITDDGEKEFYLKLKGRIAKKFDTFEYQIGPDMMRTNETELPAYQWPSLYAHRHIQAVYHPFGTVFRVDPTRPTIFRREGRTEGWLQYETAMLWKFIHRLCNNRKYKKEKNRWISNIKEFIPWIKDICTERDISGNIRLLVVEEGKNSFHPLDISDGTLMLLGRLAVLESRGVVLIIDEPEAHLHPDAIDSLMRVYREALLDPDHVLTQVIIATQSPHVVRACHPQELRIMDRSKGNISIGKISDDPNQIKETLRVAGMSLDEAWLSRLLID